MEPCVMGTPLQEFVPQPDGTIVQPATKLCWVAQNSGNTTGSTLGLAACSAPAAWDLFAFNATSGFITNTQVETLCVSGGWGPLALPSPSQLAWMSKEVSFMISFDLITELTDVPNPNHFCIGTGTGADAPFPVPPPTLFAPSESIFTDSWVAAATAANATYTLFVASHCAGFLQWQTNVSLPNGTRYPYAANDATGWRGGKGDVVEDYVQSSRKAGLPFGFYLTWNYNYLFNAGECGQGGGVCNSSAYPLLPSQINISQAEYGAMMTRTFAEVWGRYPGEIFELWFDGGERNAPLDALIAELQPQAVVTGGDAGRNLVRTNGFESGHVDTPLWSADYAGTGDRGAGNPFGPLFVSAEADSPVTAKDEWFWKPGQVYRALDELKAMYRHTVGRNALLELGVVPDNTGFIPADQFALLQQFGDYIRGCHSNDVAVNSTSGAGNSLTLSFPTAMRIDRVILQEDLSFGQLVLSYTVYATRDGGYQPSRIVVATGTSVGNKAILYFQSGPIFTNYVSVTATSLLPGVSAHWKNFAAFSPCALE